MATFRDFIQSIQTDGNDGQAFEHFCKWFLLNDPYWKTQVDKAWLWDEWPDKWGRDCGIDLDDCQNDNHPDQHQLILIVTNIE